MIILKQDICILLGIFPVVAIIPEEFQSETARELRGKDESILIKGVSIRFKIRDGWVYPDKEVEQFVCPD